MSDKTGLTYFVFILMLAALLSACGPATPAATPTPLEPTATPLPPTETPVPTSTPVPVPSLKNVRFATNPELKEPVQTYGTFKAGPAAIYAAFDYVDMPVTSTLQLQLKQDGAVVLSRSNHWTEGQAGTSIQELLGDVHLITPGQYVLSIKLGGQSIEGQFKISATDGLPGATLLVENFDDNQLGWKEHFAQMWTAKIEDGHLALTSSLANQVAFTNIPVKLQDFDLAVDVAATKTSLNSYYTIGFRQTNAGYYLFVVFTDGSFAFEVNAVAIGSVNKTLIASQRSSAIKRGNATNHIRIVAQGSKFAFYINDRLVGTISDTKLTAGLISFTASDFKQAGMSAKFDNLLITLPKEDVVVIVPTKPAPQVTAGPKPTPVPTQPPLAGSVKKTRNQVEDIGGAMDRLYHGGGSEGCTPLLADYFGIVGAPTYDVSAQPSTLQTAYDKYRAAINTIADGVAPIAKVCLTGGGSIGALDFNNARTQINEAGDLLGQALQLLGQ